MFDCLVLPKVGGNAEIKLRFSFGENLKIRLKKTRATIKAFLKRKISQFTSSYFFLFHHIFNTP